MKTRLLITLTCAALAAFTHRIYAAPGELDLTFGGTGKVTTMVGNGASYANAVAVQSDGKIVLAGQAGLESSADFAVTRYNTDGSLDTSFGGTGKVITAVSANLDSANSVVIQPDGKIVVVGEFRSTMGASDFVLVRYLADGSLDTSFNSTGIVTTDFGSSDIAMSVALQPDGKIVVSGNSGVEFTVTRKFAIARYNTNGSLDTSFGGTGKVTTDFGAGDKGEGVAVQPDGKIVVIGDFDPGVGNNDFAVIRYNADGSVDTNFGIEGKVTTDFAGVGAPDHAHSIALQPDGKIVVAGESSFEYGSNTFAFALTRYNANGTLDTNFGVTGKLTTKFGFETDRGKSVALQNDGRIVVAGRADNGNGFDIGLVRYLSNGSLDATFGDNGKVTTSMGSGASGESVAMQNGRIVVAGYYSSNGSSTDFAVVRYEGDADTDGDGISDQYETGTGVYVSPQDTGTSPTNSDSDGDELTDGQEVYTYHSNPTVKDTDDDGFDDGFEVSTGFSPTSATSTPDALSAALPAVEYRFNAALGVSYRIEASTDLANWQTIETPVIGTGGVIRRLYFIDGEPKRFFRSRRN